MPHGGRICAIFEDFVVAVARADFEMGSYGALLESCKLMLDFFFGDATGFVEFFL